MQVLFQMLLMAGLILSEPGHVLANPVTTFTLSLPSVSTRLTKRMIPSSQPDPNNLSALESLRSEIGYGQQSQTNQPTPSTSAALIKPSPYANIDSGLVAFGDSYAAGMGTGSTSWDGCRNGQFSYPNLLRLSATLDIDYSQQQCSGDVVSDLARQFDQWNQNSKSHAGTVSIGGNDVGFSKLVEACVIHTRLTEAPSCEEAVNDAHATMNDKKFQDNLSDALKKIIDAAVDDFRLYQTGYVRFFNQDTEWCNLVTFNWWWPGHHDSNQGDDWEYLTKDKRKQFNDLVNDLNSVLKGVADSVNDYYKGKGKSQKIWFIDPNDSYNGHRFCDVDDQGHEVQEPDAYRSDTWIFLSAWPDNDDKLPGLAMTSSTSNQLDLEQMQRWDNVTDASIPPGPAKASDCDDAYDKDRNQTSYFMCNAAWAANNFDAINQRWYDNNKHFLNETGNITTKIAKNSDQWNVGNYSSMTIPWYVPTRQIKTFHPRSLGHNAYKDLVEKLL